MSRRPKPPCSIDGCDRPRMARGWCKAHYSRWQRKGVADSAPFQRIPAEDATIGDDPPEWVPPGMFAAECGDCGAVLAVSATPAAIRPAIDHHRCRRCSVDSCDRFARARGMCMRHYQRQWYHDRAEVSECSVDGCQTRARALGMCSKHYAAHQRRAAAKPDEPTLAPGELRCDHCDAVIVADCAGLRPAVAYDAVFSHAHYCQPKGDQ